MANGLRKLIPGWKAKTELEEARRLLRCWMVCAKECHRTQKNDSSHDCNATNWATWSFLIGGE